MPDAVASTAVTVDRNKRKDPDPDSKMKVRAALMGFTSCRPRETAHGVAVAMRSSSASNSDLPDLNCDSGNTCTGAPSVQHPLQTVDIISALRDLLQEADEEDWFGSNESLDAHS